MDKYGSDKPDLRFGNPLVELTEYFKNTPFRVFQAPYVGAVVFKGGAATPRRQFDVGRIGHVSVEPRALLRGLRRKRRAQGPRRQEPVR